jgi:lysyl-tRNA synthetase class 2
MTEAPSHYEQERRQKRDKLRELGIDPYGGREAGVHPLKGIKDSYKPEMGHDGGPVVKAAGRVMFLKRFGKLAFLTLRDDSGDLQIALDKKRLSERDWQVQELIDLADQIVVEGPLGSTKTGEVTVWSKSLSFASKALLPPPAKWEGLSDVELRYRQRYVDTWANPEVLRVLKLRMQIVDEVRQYMRGLGYLEVETPMMQTLAGGAAARPFATHHNALDIPLYLRIAPELYLKRLLVGGFSKVFELNRNFRNEGISPRHNPEFTMIEAYEAYGSWETMADLVEGMICHIAGKLFGGLKIEHKNAGGEVTKTINLQRPWRRVRMADLVEERTGWKFDKRPLQEAYPELAEAFLNGGFGDNRDRILARFPGQLELVNQLGLAFLRLGPLRGIVHKSPAEQLQEVYEKVIEPKLTDPTFVTHVPSVIIPLARKNREDEYFADVYELAKRPRSAGGELRPSSRRRSGAAEDGRGFPHRPQVRHAAGRWNGVGDRSAGDDAHGCRKHSRCNLIPVNEAAGVGVERDLPMAAAQHFAHRKTWC